MFVCIVLALLYKSDGFGLNCTVLCMFPTDQLFHLECLRMVEQYTEVAEGKERMFSHFMDVELAYLRFRFILGRFIFYISN